jgi:hypothetical protein
MQHQNSALIIVADLNQLIIVADINQLNTGERLLGDVTSFYHVAVWFHVQGSSAAANAAASSVARGDAGVSAGGCRRLRGGGIVATGGSNSPSCCRCATRAITAVSVNIS